MGYRSIPRCSWFLTQTHGRRSLREQPFILRIKSEVMKAFTTIYQPL
jgi:hypothetical protein